jgi:hypothetical protein
MSEELSINTVENDEKLIRFRQDEMVECDECRRLSPPNRTTCIYCGAELPASVLEAKLQKCAGTAVPDSVDALNVIAVSFPASFDTDSLTELAEVVGINSISFARAWQAGPPLPVARLSSSVESHLVEKQLASLGINSITWRDSEISTRNPFRRCSSLKFHEEELEFIVRDGSTAPNFPYSYLRFAVNGRIVVRNIELDEKPGRSVDSLTGQSVEITSDRELILIFVETSDDAFLIDASAFDFSCLENDKGLTVVENLSTLRKTIAARASHLVWDKGFETVGPHLNEIWPSQQESASGGWRRSRPGRVEVKSVYSRSNELQFKKYALLRWKSRISGVNNVEGTV